MASTSNQGPNPNRGRKRRRPSTAAVVAGTVGKVLGTFLLICVITGAILLCFAAVYIKTVIIPQAHLEANFVMNQTSTIYYKDSTTGEYVEHLSLHGTENRQLVDFEEIPDNLINATVAIEDETFWKHHGVNWKRTLKGVLLMFTGGDIQGGSTITQQLIKNLTDYNETTVKRKVTEIFRALYVDSHYEKDDILELYLNVIPLGSGCEGVGAAAEKYFGKPVSDLTLAECASLIGVTNNPSKYGPYSTAQVENSEGEMWNAVQWNKYRQEVILGQMLEQGKISQEEYDEAVAQELVFVGTNSESGQSSSDIYSWYEEQVITDVMKDLQEEYDYSSQYVSQMLANGGLRIYTCVDPEVQAAAEAIYYDRSNLNYTSSKSGQQLQSAITIIDNSTGDIAGLVGRIGEKTINRGTNLATGALRQPGSSIKPLTAYGPAMEMGLLSPISVLADYPYQVLDGKAWPVNVDGRYRGQVTVTEALQWSYNTVAVRTVAMVTPAKAYEFATQRFHLNLESGRMVNGQMQSDVNLAPLSMGGLTDGVTTRQMANAFAVFPENGIYREARTYTKVEDSQGNVILDNTREDEVAVKESTAYYMNTMLQNVVQNGGGSEARISGMTVAGKTGTTDSKFDRWFVGYTPYYTAAVWVGYEYNERVTASGNPAAQLWKKVMTPIHDGLENKSFDKPSGLVQVSYCRDCGGLATTACQYDPRGNRVASGYVMQEDAPSTVCTCHSLEEGSNSLVRVCVDDPVLDENGEPTGSYHLAGPYCPEVSIRTYAYLNLDRESVGGAWAEDSQYFYSNLPNVGVCTVHNGETVLPPEGGETTDPDDPSDPNNPDPPDGGGETTDPGEEGSQEGGGESSHPETVTRSTR